MFTTHSCKAAKDQGRIPLLIDLQAHPTPFDGVALPVTKFSMDLTRWREPAGPISMSRVEPELLRTVFRQRHCNSHGIVVRHRFLHVADNLRVVDLRETQVARLNKAALALRMR